MSNDLQKLLLEFPDEDWDFNELSKNQNISFEFMEEHPEFKWNHSHMSLNPNLTLKYVLDHPEINWNWWNISQNPGITLDDIKNHPEFNNFRPGTTKFQWHWRHVVQNPNVTLDFIIDYVEEHYSFLDQVKYSGGTEKITLDDILECQTFASFSLICKHKPTMSRNPHLTLDFVFNKLPDDQDKEDDKWNLSLIGESPMITLESILEFNPDLLLDSIFMYGFSENPNVTWKMVKENPSYAWDLDFVAANPSVTMEDVEEFYDKIEDKANVSTNPNITYDWVIKNKNKVDFYALSENQLQFHKNFMKPITIRV